MSLLNPEQEAKDNGIACFNRLDWLPVWESGTQPTLADTVTKDPDYSPKDLEAVDLLQPRVDTLRTKFSDELFDHLTTTRQIEKPNAPDTGTPLTQMPLPNSDFSHVDVESLTPDDKNLLSAAAAAINAAAPAAAKDGELNEIYQDGLNAVNRAQSLLGVDPKGMQRLKLLFEWILCHVTTIYGEINAALNDNSSSTYTSARNRYIALLKDLDDPEPETSGPLKPGERGYGLAIKWASIEPQILNGRILGAKVQAKWNPHISSSGIPIPHK